MNNEKEWLRSNATIREKNRITLKPEIMKALNLKVGDMVNLQVRKMESREKVK